MLLASTASTTAEPDQFQHDALHWPILCDVGTVRIVAAITAIHWPTGCPSSRTLKNLKILSFLRMCRTTTWYFNTLEQNWTNIYLSITDYIAYSKHVGLEESFGAQTSFLSRTVLAGSFGRSWLGFVAPKDCFKGSVGTSKHIGLEDTFSGSRKFSETIQSASVQAAWAHIEIKLICFWQSFWAAPWPGGREAAESEAPTEYAFLCMYILYNYIIIYQYIYIYIYRVIYII